MHIWSCFISQITCKASITSHCLWPQLRDQMESFVEGAFLYQKGWHQPHCSKVFLMLLSHVYFLLVLHILFFNFFVSKDPRLCLCWMEKAPNGNTCKLAQKKPQNWTGWYVPENICSYRADQLLSNSARLLKCFLPHVLGEGMRCLPWVGYSFHTGVSPLPCCLICTLKPEIL